MTFGGVRPGTRTTPGGSTGTVKSHDHALPGRAGPRPGSLTRSGSSFAYCCGGAASRMTAPRSSLSTSTANRSTGCSSGVLTEA